MSDKTKVISVNIALFLIDDSNLGYYRLTGKKILLLSFILHKPCLNFISTTTSSLFQ